MKFLVVFISALVLVAHGDVSTSDEEDSVYAIKSEVVAGYAVQEADGPQGVFAEEAPAVRVFGVEDEPRVSSSEEPKGSYAVEDPAAEPVPALQSESGVYIPIDSRVCTNLACANVCNRLGFRYGICISLDTCWCYN